MSKVVQAHLLVIDNLLLAEIARDALGNALDVLEDSAASFCAYLLSFWLSGNMQILPVATHSQRHGSGKCAWKQCRKAQRE